MKTLCVISARGGSQGVPGKNIRPLLGKPVITWAVEKALKIGSLDRVAVSTDSEHIAAIAADAGADIPFIRPAALAQSDTGKFEVWKHALVACERHYQERYEAYVDIDCTNPLIEATDIAATIEHFRTAQTRGIDAVFTVAHARRNPYFNLVEPDENGIFKMCKSRGKTVVARQAAPPVFEHVAGVYVLARDYVMRASHLLDGRTEGHVLREDQAFDIDSELDFELIEYLLRRKLAAVT